MKPIQERQLNADIIKGIIDGLIEGMDESSIEARYQAYLERFKLLNQDNKEDYNFYLGVSEKASSDREKVENQIKANLFNKSKNKESSYLQYKKTDLRCEIALMLMETKYQRFFENLTKQQIINILGLSGSKLINRLELKAIAKIETQLDRSIKLEEVLEMYYQDSYLYNDKMPIRE